jgi:hypothetical protein
MRFAFALTIALVSITSLSGCMASEADVSQAELRGGCRYVCPRCRPNQPCPRIACYLECHGPSDPQACGDRVCGTGEYCCNPSCSTCAPEGGFCTQQYCEPPTTGGCTTDADCRTFSDYCTGCDCRALGVSEPDPVCESPGVRCFADPCLNQTAACVSGACVLTATAAGI